MIRTEYMKNLMTSTYPNVAIEAFKNGFQGSWERCIAKKLREDYNKGNSEAECLVQSIGGLSDQKLIELAHLITSSKIKEHANNQ
jgi:hypothetical protein